MIIFATAVAVSVQKRPDSKKSGRVKISVRPKQALHGRPENVKQVGGRVSKVRPQANCISRVL